MSTIDLSALGITQEELQNRVVESMVSKLFSSYSMDEDGDEYEVPSRLKRRLDDQIRKAIDEGINKVAEKHIYPIVNDKLESLVLQETNSWGEKKGEPVTFIQYLIGRSEKWLTEEVNYEGKPRSASDSYGWKGTQTRVSHLINSHLHYSIETAMKQAVQQANSVIVSGIQDTVKIKLKEVSDSLKVIVKTN